MTLRLFPLALLLLGGVALAEAKLERTDLFEAGRDGYKIFRIPGLVVTTKGTVLAYCEARKTGSDWGEIDLLMRRSTDGGRTWAAPARVAEIPEDAKRNPVAPKKPGEPASEVAITLNNPVAIADKDGAVHLLYCVEYARCFYRRSDDDGLTFSPAVEITKVFEPYRDHHNWRVVATGPGHGIQLRNGRLIVPVWLALGTGANGHGGSRVLTIYSDDGGKTWAGGDLVKDWRTLRDPNESAVVELSDGRVMLNTRHPGEPHVRATMTSHNGFGLWSVHRFDPQLPEPVCMASLARLPDGGILFSNPHVERGRERKNLTVKLSRDDGATWAMSRALEPGPSAYSDLAVTPDGTIYCLYERGEKGPYERLTLARFNVEWLKLSPAP
jgi:sialidase-1